jgi:xanthine dehydrogenase iron-sulfur cluster and FAD-binding subunit A
MESFAVDEDPIDIEEVACNGDCKLCPQLSSCCKTDVLMKSPVVVGMVNASSGVTRYRPSTVLDAISLLNNYKASGVQIVAGDTGKGVFKYQIQLPYLIDVTGISSLYSVSSDGKTLTVGSAVSLSGLISELQVHQQEVPKGSKLNKLASHLSRVANVAVRNVSPYSTINLSQPKPSN